MSFNDKVVIITGASSGIGATLAVLYAKEGASVAIVARNETKLQQIAKECEKFGNKPLVIRADVSNDDDAKRIVDETIERYGKLDVLVNNAGIAEQGSLLNGKALEAYDAVMKTNVRAVVNLTSLAAPHLIRSKGNIVNVSSAAALCVSPTTTNFSYCVSKAALDHFTRCAALELAPSGVRVNGVNPGPVDNEFLGHNGFGNPNQYLDIMKSKTALGCVSTNEDVGHIILFLSSEKAKSVTGASYLCDSGYVIKN